MAYGTPLHPEKGYGNGGIQYMLATEHANTAIQNVRALDYLTAITGNYDTPGGQRASTRAPIEGGQMGFANNGSGMPMLSPGQMEKILGRDEIPLLYWWGISVIFLSACLLRAAPPSPFEHRISFCGYAFCERF